MLARTGLDPDSSAPRLRPLSAPPRETRGATSPARVPVIPSERSESRDPHRRDAVINSRDNRLLLCGLLALVTLASGCRRADEHPRGSAPPSRAASKRPRIALIMKSLANEFFVTMAAGAKKNQEEHAGDYELIVNGIKDESDLSQQVALVEQMVASGVDAIVIAPADSRALVPSLRKAQKAGVVVVNIDNKLDDATLATAGVAIPFVGPDNREGARMVGAELAKHLHPGDAVAIVEGIPTAFNAQQRRQGFEEAMRAAQMRVVAVQSGQWEQVRANAVVSAMLREHPELKAILASNDNMALGAVAAVRQGGKAGQVVVVGFDNISAIREMLRDGRVLATADQHAAQLAVFGIEYALQILRSQAKPQDRRTPVDLVTAEKL
jgi:ribose transport system substrate-binding protein